MDREDISGVQNVENQLMNKEANKIIEHEARLAVHIDDENFWKRWEALVELARERGDTFALRILSKVAQEQEISESFDQLLTDLRG